MQKMSLIYMKMNLQMKGIFITMVSHEDEDSFWHRGKEQLGNGLFEQKQTQFPW